MEISINPRTIKLYTLMICEPNKFDIDILPLKDVLIKSDQLIPNDLLYKQYLDYIAPRPLPKLIFYIIMRDVFGDPRVDSNSENKNAGYYLNLNEELIKSTQLKDK